MVYGKNISSPPTPMRQGRFPLIHTPRTWLRFPMILIPLYIYVVLQMPRNRRGTRSGGDVAVLESQFRVHQLWSFFCDGSISACG